MLTPGLELKNRCKKIIKPRANSPLNPFQAKPHLNTSQHQQKTKGFADGFRGYRNRTSTESAPRKEVKSQKITQKYTALCNANPTISFQYHYAISI